MKVIKIPAIRRIVDITPILEVMSNDQIIYTTIFNTLDNLKLSSMDSIDDKAELKRICTMLNVEYKGTKDEDEFAGLVGMCQREVLLKSAQIRKELTDLLKSISSEGDLSKLFGETETKKPTESKEDELSNLMEI